MARRLVRVPPRAVLLFLVCAAPLLRPDIAAAQGALPRYEVTGFRAARFGMTEFEVRQIVHKSLGVDDDRMTPVEDTSAGTTKLIVHVPMLEPGLGEGRVEYVFGHTRHELFQVNVIWGLDTNPPLSNLAMLTGALRLQRYFLGFSWAIRSVQTGILLDDRSILLFSGVDERDGAVSVVLEDVRYELVSGNIRLISEPSMPTMLTVSYMDQSHTDDLRRISRSAF